MKNLIYLTSASALLAIMAFRQHTAKVMVPKLRPATGQRIKSLKRTRQTAAVTDVVAAANAFLATLTTAQQATVLQSFTSTNVIKWSNFPIAGYRDRIGIRFDALTAAQRTAALAVIQAATGTGANEGFDEIQQIRAADDWLVNNGSSSSVFNSNYYFLAFLGQPSATGTWML